MARTRPVPPSWPPAALALAATLLLAGCGANSSLLPSSSSPHPTQMSPRVSLPELRTIPAPKSTGTPARPAEVRVIEGWAGALLRGQVRSAAAYFNLPSEFFNGVVAGGVLRVIRIRTVTEAEAVNEALPCGAELMSADQRGPYVNALFRLTGRGGPGGSSCGSGAGATARTNFLIKYGRIVAWIRAPDDPGDNGSPSTPGNPSSPGSSTPV